LIFWAFSPLIKIKNYSLLLVAVIFVSFLILFLTGGALSLRLVAAYMIYFYLGCFFQDNIFHVRTFINKLSYWRIILLFLLQLLIFVLYALGFLVESNPLTILLSPYKVILGTLGILLTYSIIYQFTEKTKGTAWNIFESRLFLSIKRNAIGVYLLHFLIITILFSYIKAFKILPIVLVSVSFLLSLFISLFLCKQINKNKYLKQLFFGG
jgi:hypothetical protein